jgi:RNA polymerase sigma-70 factor, ECF subfamily
VSPEHLHPAAALAEVSAGAPDLETLFQRHYLPIARTIGTVVHSHALAEELAVEVFLRWPGHAPNPAAWLYRTAVNLAVDHLRRSVRHARLSRFIPWLRPPATPGEIHEASAQQARVRLVLAMLPRRQSQLLLLRTQGLAYAELAAALQLNPASIGTLLSRAQQNFRKEYVARYGER